MTSFSWKIALKYADLFSRRFYVHSAISIVTYAIVNVFLVWFCFFLFSNLISDVSQPLSQIRMSLAGSLGAAQVIFLGGINFTENTVRNFPWLVQSLWKISFKSLFQKWSWSLSNYNTTVILDWTEVILRVGYLREPGPCHISRLTYYRTLKYLSWTCWSYR